MDTTGFDICAYSIPVSEKRFASQIKVERANRKDGPARWAVRLDGDCLNKQGIWEWEPLPSSRDDDFLARCRFDSVEEAFAAVRADLACALPPAMPTKDER